MILIELRHPTERGRLYPRYVEGAGILAVQSSVTRPWPYGINIDGMMVLDIDEDRVLANVDLHLRRSLWRVEKTLERRVPSRKADIAISEESIRQKSLSLPVKVVSDAARRCVAISFPESLNSADAVELSPGCLALVRGDELLGFQIDLEAGEDEHGGGAPSQ